MNPLELLLAAHALATIAMTGLVWFVQIVHYPLFVRIGAADFAAYHRGHLDRTGRVVVPLMLLELATACAVPFAASADLRGPALAGLVMLLSVWGSTFFIQVPLHRRLGQSPSVEARDRLTRRLVVTNGIRTALWSARAVLALWLLIRAG